MKLRSFDRRPLLFALATTWLLAGCESRESEPQDAASVPAVELHALKPVAGIQDLMAYMIDPAADFLWDSVSTISNEKGVEEKRPKTDEEWNAVRREALMLTEAANLLLVEGRQVAKEGALLEDHGTPGNLTAEESQRAIAADRKSYVAFAEALRDAGAKMLSAADTKNAQELFDMGYPLDQVFEGCHLKFWYPAEKTADSPSR